MKNTEYNTELKNITKNAGFGGFGVVFTNVMGFFNNAIITRVLGAELYGLFVLATNIITFIGYIAQLGFSSTLVRYVSFFTGKQEYGKAKGTILYGLRLLFFFSIFLGVASFLLSPLISQTIFNRPELTSLLRMLTIALPFMGATVIFLAALVGLKLIKHYVISINIINPVTFLIAILAVFLLGYSLIALIWAWVFVAVIVSIFSFYFLNNEYFIKQRKTKPIVEKKELWSFARPMYLNGFVNNAIKVVPVLIIGYFLPDNEVGIFNISFKVALLVSFSLLAFRQIFAPSVSALFARGKIQLIEELNKTITKWIFTISLIIFFNIILFSKSILSVFGAEFIVGANVLLILALGELISSGMGLAGNILEMSGRPKVELLNTTATLVLILVLNYLLIPVYGITGAAVSYSVTIALVNLARVIELFVFEKIHPFKFSYLKPVVAGVAAFAIVFWIKNIVVVPMYWEMVVGAICFIVLFISFVWILKLDSEDKYILQTVTGKFINKKKKEN